MTLPRWLRAGMVVGLGIAAYANTLHAPLVFDDSNSLELNESIRTLSPAALMPPPETSVAGRPVANLTFALNYATTRLRLVPLHCTNLALHLLAALLLMALIQRTLLLPRFGGRYQASAGGIALACALVWALHPVQTESVTYLTQRVESLAAFFLLLMLDCALHAHEAARPFGWTAAAVLACGLGMASKETMVVAPLIAALYDRAFLYGSWHEAYARRRRLWFGLAATWLVLLLQVVTGGRSQSAGFHFPGFGPLEYFKIQCGAILHYLRLLVVPVGLIFDYGEAGSGVPLVQSFSQWLPQALALMLLFGLGVLAWVKRPPVGFLILSCFILLGPSSSIVPITSEVISEHRLYLPSAAALVLLVVAAHRLLQRPRWLAPAVATAAIATLGALTFRRNAVYQSPISLWRDTAGKWPDNARAWVSLMQAYRSEVEDFRAHEEYRLAMRRGAELLEQAVRRDPEYLSGLMGLAIIEADNFELTGDPKALELSIGYYRRYLALKDTEAEAHLNFAHALEKSGRTAEALAHYLKAVELRPTDAQIAGEAANSLGRSGRADQAQAMIRGALSLAPDWARGHYYSGSFYAGTRRYDLAIAEFDKAIALDGKLAAAWHRRGLVEAWAGLPDRAVRDLDITLRLEPANTETMEDLAKLLATVPDPRLRDGQRALALAEASRAASETVRSLEVLAAAQAETGRFDLAALSESRAIELASRGGQKIGALKQRLAAYQHRQPWREQPAQ